MTGLREVKEREKAKHKRIKSTRKEGVKVGPDIPNAHALNQQGSSFYSTAHH